MGGGYDTCEDADVPTDTCKTTGKGNGVFLLDADTGALLTVFPTDRPVIGDVFVVTDSVTGLAKWAYAADLGGNIYRISGGSRNLAFKTTPYSGWNITKIASLGCATPATCASNRKFMFMPDIVEKDDTYYLLVGSGDREKPLDAWTNTYATTNYFFMVKDKPEEAGWLDGTCDTGAAAPNDKVICLTSLTGITTSADPAANVLASSKGWYLGLNAHEQVVTSAITVFGNVTFSTHTPTVPVSGSCTSNLGTARVYNVRYLDASAKPGNNNRSAVVSGGGLPPSPVAGKVTLDDGTTYPFVIGADPSSSLESSLPSAPSTGTQPKSLTYWFIEK
jgi:type IV pilus assembly protein PilY1